MALVKGILFVDGDDAKIKEVKDTISKQIFHEEMHISSNYFGELQIVPWVFKKESKSHKSRLVDISITIDSMRFSYTDAADVLCFISGDGDFLNLYSELMRNGKKVSVAALSSGLSEDVKHSVDYFINLDEVLLQNWGCKTGVAKLGLQNWGCKTGVAKLGSEHSFSLY